VRLERLSFDKIALGLGVERENSKTQSNLTTSRRECALALGLRKNAMLEEVIDIEDQKVVAEPVKRLDHEWCD